MVSILILLDYLFLYSVETSARICAEVSILILLDYLFLWADLKGRWKVQWRLNPYFTGLSILILEYKDLYESLNGGLNPYFTGLSILIGGDIMGPSRLLLSQSLFYWIIYSYNKLKRTILMKKKVSILILLDYLFL